MSSNVRQFINHFDVGDAYKKADTNDIIAILRIKKVSPHCPMMSVVPPS